MKHIQNILDDHIEMYGLRPEISLKALVILFNHNLYEECILEVLRHYNISVKLRIVKTELENANARIRIMDPMPAYNSLEFKNERFVVEYDRKYAVLSMERFIFAIAHELGHVFLYSRFSPHRHSEQATDLIAMVMGFDAAYEKSRMLVVPNQSIFSNKQEFSIVGYLSEEELSFARNYLIKKRKEIL